MNYSSQMDSFRTRFEQALGRPIQHRCAELTVLIDRGNMNDLHQIFPLLIDNIFKPNGGLTTWELRNITNTGYSQDFQALQHFFSPTGPLFKMIYHLLTDPNIKFPFSLSYLPSKVMYGAVGGNKHPFYADLIQTDGSTNRVISLMLNPFDYYIFHFAYHLINPRDHLISSAWNTLYYVLCCDYILHFLPTEPGKEIFPLIDYYCGKNPTYTLPCFNQSPVSSRLLRTDMLNVQKIQTHESHLRNKIWRSETIVTVFIDFWLNNDQVVNSSHNFDNFSMQQNSFKVNELPTGEYIRIIRVLVKQLHAFGSSASYDDTSLGELKKIVIPYLQGRIYFFLRHLMHQWPLNGSFRLVLELWLSFLQPWRYPGLNQNSFMKEVNPDVDDLSTAPTKAVDFHYVGFIAENLLCYSVLLQQLIPRFTRVDLSSPKLALILFRMLKVFARPNLVTYLKEIEGAVGCLRSSPVHSFNNTTVNQAGLPPLSPTSSWSSNVIELHRVTKQHNLHEKTNYYPTSNTSAENGKWGISIKQKILEYEGPSFTYKPIFNAPTAPEIYELHRNITTAIIRAEQIVKTRENDLKKFSFSIVEIFKSMFVYDETSIDEFTIEDRKLVPIWLKTCKQFLESIFFIEEHVQSSINQTYAPNTVPEANKCLTIKEMKERVLNSKYEGNPDLMPIRSDEVEILVKLLHELAAKINEKWSLKIVELYDQPSFAGELIRQLVSPPCEIHRYVKHNAESSRVTEQLPARFNFRYFACYRFLIHFMIITSLSYFSGNGYWTFTLIIFFIWTLWILVKTIIGLCKNRTRLNATPDTSVNFLSSSNDSF